jgi:hypothetical protein
VRWHHFHHVRVPLWRQVVRACLDGGGEHAVTVFSSSGVRSLRCVDILGAWPTAGASN